MNLAKLSEWRAKRLENARTRSVIARANARRLHELAERASPPDVAAELQEIAGTMFQLADANTTTLSALLLWPFYASGIARWPKRRDDGGRRHEAVARVDKVVRADKGANAAARASMRSSQALLVDAADALAQGQADLARVGFDQWAALIDHVIREIREKVRMLDRSLDIDKSG